MAKLGLIPEALVALCGATVLTVITYFGLSQLGVYNINELSWWEFLGVTGNYACVWLTARQNILCWPIGIAAVACLVVVFFQFNLLASLTLHVAYFLPIQFIGWWTWAHGNNGDALGVTSLSFPQWGYTLLMVPFAWYGVYYINTLFGGAIPVFDTAILVLSVIAAWLMNFKKIESWVFWICVNILGTYVYLTSGAMLLGVQYSLFLINAFYGFTLWYKDLGKPQPYSGPFETENYK